jgi:ABC-2 type transport system permease protein
VVSASALSDYDYSNLYSGKSRDVYRTHFKGELLFTSKIYGVAMQRSPKAYFLIGHGESDPRDTTSEGYSKFAMVLQGENNFELALLDLTSQKDVPADCNLLIVSGPLTVIDEQQAERIQRYLEKGGRLLLLFNYRQLATRRPSGLEKLLAAWGVEAGENIVVDPDNSTTSTGTDPKPAVPGKHPIVSSLGSAQTHLFMPRTMHALKTSTPRREEAKVEELLFTGPRTQLITKLGERGAYEPQRGVGPQPLCVAVEKSIPAIDRGSTRIVALGDSTLWANNVIESDANREFAASTVNWLVQQNVLLAEIPRQAIRTYRLSMTRAQLRNSRWLLLAAMPGAVLLFGCLVWMRRRS